MDRDLCVVADAAQSFGSILRGRRTGQFGQVTATSFFPAKPLGCCGDGGEVNTDDDDLATAMRSLRLHGQGSGKSDTICVGFNARFDTMQAAVLLQKLMIFDDELLRRQAITDRYGAELRGVVAVSVADGATRAWARSMVQSGQWDSLSDLLRLAGIPPNVYNPEPLHKQTAYLGFPRAKERIAVSEMLSRQVVSLRMHLYLKADDQRRVVAMMIKHSTS